MIEDGEVHVFDVQRGGFVPAAQADNAGTGPYLPHTQQLAPKRAAALAGSGLASEVSDDEDSTRL